VSRDGRPGTRPQLGREARSDVSVIAKGGAVQITGQLMQGGLSFVFVAIAVRILGTTDYGLFRQAVQALAIAGQVGLLGFNYSAMRFIARSRATGNPGGVRGAAWTALTSVSVTSGVGLFVLLIGADSLAAQFADHPARVCAPVPKLDRRLAITELPAKEGVDYDLSECIGRCFTKDGAQSWARLTPLSRRPRFPVGEPSGDEEEPPDEGVVA
jgi:hypothetical protein